MTNHRLLVNVLPFKLRCCDQDKLDVLHEKVPDKFFINAERVFPSFVRIISAEILSTCEVKQNLINIFSFSENEIIVGTPADRSDSTLENPVLTVLTVPGTRRNGYHPLSFS